MSTILGTNEDDVLTGDDSAAVVDELFLGRGGDDLLRGGLGDDTLKGSNGNDTLNGGQGSDNLNGGNDDDLLRGSDGNDFLMGASGNDTLAGDQGNDTLSGGEGEDRFFFSAENGGERDVINDYVADEMIVLSGVAVASVEQRGDDTEILLTNDTTIVLRDFLVDDLVMSNVQSDLDIA